MDRPFHRFSELFAQLGLPFDDASIGQFIASHAPLAADIRLADAPCWNEAQARLLRESISDDADWAEVVDQLDVALRQP